MKSQLKSLAVTCLLSASVLGACGSPPASSSTPSNPSTPAAVAPQAEANVQVAVTRITEKAFNDKAFSQELQANPKAVLAAEGLSLAADDKVKVVDFLNEAGKVYMILDDRNLERFYGEQIKNAPSDAEADEGLKTFRAIRAKAQSDATFKASLLADPATVLAAEGLNAEAAKNFEVLDFEADTHFFLILPPDQQVNRIFINISVAAFMGVITAAVGVLRYAILELNPNFFNNVGRGEILVKSFAANAVSPSVNFAVNTSVDGVFHTIEALCFWPRVFGSGCGASKEDIKNTMLELL